MTLEEVGLTPSQLAELEHVEGGLVTAWLDALEHVPAAINNPTAWFIAGIRSGNKPGSVAEPEQLTRVRLAERWVRNAGLYEPDEPSLLDALFGEHGSLRAMAADGELRERMLRLWRHEQPRVEQAQAEQLDRAERWKQAHAAMQALSNEPKPDGHAPQTERSSQTSTALTAVSAHSTRDPDADIAW